MEKRLSHVMISVIIVCDRSQLVVVVRSEATTSIAGGCIAEWVVLPDMQIPIGKTFEFSKLNLTVGINGG